MTTDEGIRETTLETLAKLKPVVQGGRRRSPPATRSQITDGASAVLIMSEEKADELGLTPAGPVRRRSPWPAPTRG